jgi:hypothetical protein
VDTYLGVVGNFHGCLSCVICLSRYLFHTPTASFLEFFLVGAPRSSVASGAGREPGIPRRRHWRRTYPTVI